MLLRNQFTEALLKLKVTDFHFFIRKSLHIGICHVNWTLHTTLITLHVRFIACRHLFLAILNVFSFSFLKLLIFRPFPLFLNISEA